MKQALFLFILFSMVAVSLPAEEVVEISASGFLQAKSDICRYHVLRMFDDDPKTAWVEGKEGPGIGEYVLLRFDNPVPIDTIKIMPGYFDREWYLKNNRVKKISITINNANTITATLPDGMTIDEIKLPVSPGIKEIQIKIKDIYKGSTYDDTCIAELAFFYRGKKIPLDFSSTYEYLGLQLAEEFSNTPSPAGYKIVEYGMFGSSCELFFPDGTYVSRYSDSIGGKYGKWRMSNNEQTVEIYDVIQKYLDGSGDYIFINEMDEVYENYTLVETPEKDNSFSWPVHFQDILLTMWDVMSIESITDIEYQYKMLTTEHISDELYRLKQKYQELKKQEKDSR